MLTEFRGQTYVVTNASTNAWRKKQFKKGKLHALDAARMAMRLLPGRHRPDQEAKPPEGEPVLDSSIAAAVFHCVPRDDHCPDFGGGGPDRPESRGPSRHDWTSAASSLHGQL